MRFRESDLKVSKMSADAEYSETVGTLTVSDPPWFVFDQFYVTQLNGGTLPYTVTYGDGLLPADTEIWVGRFEGRLYPPPMEESLFRIKNTSQTNSGSCRIVFKIYMFGDLVTTIEHTTLPMAPQETRDIGSAADWSPISDGPILRLGTYSSLYELLRTITNNFNEQEISNPQGHYMTIQLFNQYGALTASTQCQLQPRDFGLFDIDCTFKTTTIRRGTYSKTDIFTSGTVRGILFPQLPPPLPRQPSTYRIYSIIEVVRPTTGAIVKQITHSRLFNEGGVLSSPQYFEIDLMSILPDVIDLSDVPQGTYKIRIGYKFEQG